MPRGISVCLSRLWFSFNAKYIYALKVDDSRLQQLINIEKMETKFENSSVNMAAMTGYIHWLGKLYK